MLITRIYLIEAAVICSLATQACLPDPRAYDACIDDRSYYEVGPTGCNGHQLEELGSRSAKTPQSSSRLIRGSIAIGREHVYWTSTNGDILKTPKGGGKTSVLYEASKASAPSYIKLTESDGVLYALIAKASSSERLINEPLAIDPSSGNAEAIAGFPSALPAETPDAPALGYFLMTTIEQQVREGQYYSNAGTDACLLSGSLTLQADAGPSFSCLTQKRPSGFLIREEGVYFVAQDADTSASNLQAPSLSSLQVPSSSTASLYFQATGSDEASRLAKASVYATDIQVYGEEVYFTDCNPSRQVCARFRRDPTGTKTALFDSDRQPFIVIGDEKATYTVERETYSSAPARMYHYNHVDLTSNVVSASLERVQAMALDSDYVYLTAIDETSVTDNSIRLFRLKR